MSNIDVKCIYCGKVFKADTDNEKTTCLECGKTFSTARAIKYLKSLDKIVSEEKKVAYGEMYNLADKLITEGEFYLKNNDFSQAKTSFLKALEITTVDRRIYIGLVKTLTENFTDLQDDSHFEYLNKAISLSTKQQKDELRKMYSAYYQKRNLSDEEMQVIDLEECESRKHRVESLLKDGIPKHYATLKSAKTTKILLPIITALFIVFGILSFLNLHYVVEFISTIAALISLVTIFVFIIQLSGAYSKTSIYDCALDLYDEEQNLKLPIKERIELYTLLEEFAVDYLNGVTTVTLENHLTEIAVLLANSKSSSANEFITRYKILRKLIKETEEI